jgi:hypothetical protein
MVRLPPMRVSVIACEILFRELCRAAAESPLVIDLQFIRKGLHDDPDALRLTLQERIDALDLSDRSAVVLGYGLCSNGTAGLKAREVPLVIPRVHDCISLFLGSKERYAEFFAQRPGTYYYTSGWLERGGDKVPQPPQKGGGLMDTAFEELVARYGEDNARFLMEFQTQWRANYSHACYVRMPLSHREEYRHEVEKIAKENGWEYMEVEGDDRLIRKLAYGEWDEQEFLVVQPGQVVRSSYDHCILRCAEACG